RIDGSREEELEQPLVAELVDLGLAGDPTLGGPPPLGRELVEVALPGALRGVGALDQAGILEALQLGVDLAVTRRPEEPGGAVDQLLDLVARARLARQHPENHLCGGAQLHYATRYINKIYRVV